MTTRRGFLGALPVAGAAIAASGFPFANGAAQAQEAPTAEGELSWHSPSLTNETATGPNGAITTRVALDVNRRGGLDQSAGGTANPADKTVEEVVKGVYHIRGWGIAHSIAIDAPDGWIIIDTGDSTRVAAEKREYLEKAVGKKIRVAAILLTHWHYADGTAAWTDEGTELWGHEFLDANRSRSVGVSVERGNSLARAFAQFGVLHPVEGPDAFPNLMGFTLEKFFAESSYRPPTKLFENGEIINLTIAGEPIEIAPNRSDTTDSVGFYFANRRTLVTNFMVIPFIFNIYTLRGGSFRDPTVFISDARWLEEKNAEALLDIHGPGLRGAQAVREAIERTVDQVQLIRDQTLRLLAHGMDAREAAENFYMPTALREGYEAYGQVESHVRQVVNGTVGWFGNDVYDINPLSLREEAARTIDMMGGVGATRKAAADAADQGGLANWRWALKLTSMLLRLDPADADARKARAFAARALGQRTTSANARGFYVTEALQLEGQLLLKGQPVTTDILRGILGTPSIDQLTGAEPAENFEFLRYLVDPRKAEGKNLSFTVAVEGGEQLTRIQLRNCVMVVTNAASKGETHIDLSRLELAEFVLGLRTLAAGNDRLADFEQSLDRSHMILNPQAMPSGDPKYIARDEL
jgi:alkyl sulfatase BDS1-like metallo-beta-lactamase superfamily hydrolase